MSSQTELKLLTLLNVTAVKRPRESDQPGGYRSSPPVSKKASLNTASHLNGNGVGSPVPNGNTPSLSADENSQSPTVNGSGIKRKRSVVFGGEVGPSGSTFVNGKKKGGLKGKEKAADDSPAPNANGAKSNGNGSIGSQDLKGLLNGFHGLEDLATADDSEDEDSKLSTADADSWNVHFAADSPILTPEGVAAVAKNEWKSEKRSLDNFGRVTEQVPGQASTSAEAKNRLTPSLLTSLKATGPSPLVSTALKHLGTYQDMYLHSLDGEADGSEKVLFGPTKEAMRKAIVVHALNHVLKTRRRIIRNNEKLHHASLDPNLTIESPRDQSFTRPKILFLFPLRSIAHHYLSSHLFPFAPKDTQIENRQPFNKSFGVDPAEDPLGDSSAEKNFPLDHIVNFRGNNDDNFRFGIKLTRKAWRVVMPPASEEKLMDCDILVASPLGLKMAAEREESTDLLSSIEVCVADGMDVMNMQNWDHVKFVFDHLNEIPKSPHGCDFSRVKPWYLEGQAKYLRQTILLSRYDSPEGRAVFSKQCFNLAGKLRLESPSCPGVLMRVKSGVKQSFERVDLDLKGGEGPVEEVEKRLQWFLKKTIPALQRSAISRQTTLIIVPSYFDFVRLNNSLRKLENFSSAAISEYSSNTEISRARTLFFKGKINFLLVTERFHFYRRYILRGAKTIVWYQLPEHSQFYSEFLSMPFLPSRKEAEAGLEEGMVDVEEVKSFVLFSRFDSMRLERVVGTRDARKMLTSGEARFEFV